MAIALVQHNIDAAFSASPVQNTALTNNITSGNLVCGFIWAANPSPTITASDGTNTYIVSPFFTDPVNGPSILLFYKEGVSAGAGIKQITFTSAGNSLAMAVMEFSGVATSSALRGSIVGQADASVSGTSGSAGTAIGAVGDLIISGIILTNATFTPSVSDGVLTLLDGQPVVQEINADAYVLSAPGAVNPSYSFQTNLWAVAAAAFKIAGSTGPSPQVTYFNNVF